MQCKRLVKTAAYNNISETFFLIKTKKESYPQIFFKIKYLSTTLYLPQIIAASGLCGLKLVVDMQTAGVL